MTLTSKENRSNRLILSAYKLSWEKEEAALTHGTVHTTEALKNTEINNREDIECTPLFLAVAKHG